MVEEIGVKQNRTSEQASKNNKDPLLQTEGEVQESCSFVWFASGLVLSPFSLAVDSFFFSLWPHS